MKRSHKESKNNINKLYVYLNLVLPHGFCMFKCNSNFEKLHLLLGNAQTVFFFYLAILCGFFLFVTKRKYNEGHLTSMALYSLNVTTTQIQTMTLLWLVLDRHISVVHQSAGCCTYCAFVVCSPFCGCPIFSGFPLDRHSWMCV